ncbi:MAG: uracil-DNA glycosylase [Oligoflexia bacterium]|nr:uracil-DNA glycosylase [Oligoflexia bacterium]
MNGHTNAEKIERSLRFLYGDVLDIPLQFDDDQEIRPITNTTSIETPKIESCTLCDLYIGRTKAVIAKGSLSKGIAFIGDYPNNIDDEEGSPFSGSEGDLLRKMVLAMNLDPEKVFYTNLFKCKPPVSFVFTEEHFKYCPEIYLQEQIKDLKIIVALGEMSSRYFYRSLTSLDLLRGQPFAYWNKTKVYATHHPRTLLKQPNLKKEAWADLQKVMKEITSENI